MTLLEFFGLLIVAGICGGVAQSIVGYSHQGCLVSIFLGFVGALLGTWLSRQLGLPEFIIFTFGDQPFPVIWSIIGASLFVALLALISGRQRRR
ncbi:MAG: Transglycosylase associated protein [Planctomycetaceae bacterium]|nr:Transglycosylase associated protein [Planctomycetaceae bacterium]